MVDSNGNIVITIYNKISDCAYEELGDEIVRRVLDNLIDLALFFHIQRNSSVEQNGTVLILGGGGLMSDENLIERLDVLELIHAIETRNLGQLYVHAYNNDLIDLVELQLAIRRLRHNAGNANLKNCSNVAV